MSLARDENCMEQLLADGISSKLAVVFSQQSPLGLNLRYLAHERHKEWKPTRT